MQTFKFEGHSDDTFGEYGITNIDHDNCASGSPIQFTIKMPDGSGIAVTGMYCHGFHIGEGWMIGAETLCEDNPVDWTITMKPSHEGYKNQLTVIAPDDAALVCVSAEYDPAA